MRSRSWGSIGSCPFQKGLHAKAMGAAAGGVALDVGSGGGASMRHHGSAGIADLDRIVSTNAIDDRGHDPAQRENRDDQIAKRTEIVVERADKAPERAVKTQLASDEAEHLDP